MEPFIKINGRPFPYPKRGLELLVSTFVDSARNTSGEVVGQKVGRDQYKINRCEWPVLSADQWSTMLAMLDEFFVVVTFPDPVRKVWRSLKMYPGDRSAEPYFLDEETGLPRLYRNCKVNLIDAGYTDTEPPLPPPQYTLQSKRVSPSEKPQSIQPDHPTYYGLSEVVVEAAKRQSKRVKPAPVSQRITPDTGYYGLSEVIVEPGGDSSDATATTQDVLSGKTAYARGTKLTGAMPNNGKLSGTIDGLTVMSYNIPKGYTDGGSVTLTGDIENRLKLI